MKLFVIWGQRKCSYEEQYAPEALACCDEICMEDNSEYIYGEFEKYTKSNEFSSLAIAETYFSDESINSMLSLTRKLESGSIKTIYSFVE